MRTTFRYNKLNTENADRCYNVAYMDCNIGPFLYSLLFSKLQKERNNSVRNMTSEKHYTQSESHLASFARNPE